MDKVNTYVCEECNNFQDSNFIFLFSDFKIFPILLLRQLIVVYCWFNSYFTFIAEAKLHFSLVCSFYCCFVKNGWALKAAKDFVIWELQSRTKSYETLEDFSIGSIRHKWSGTWYLVQETLYTCCLTSCRGT